jgi:hypothetical protein
MPIIVLTHVIIALASITLSSFTFFKPTMKRLYASYGFIVATVASGTFLLVSTPSHILESCLMGLFYLTVVSVATIATHIRIRRLAKQEI